MNLITDPIDIDMTLKKNPNLKKIDEDWTTLTRDLFERHPQTVGLSLIVAMNKSDVPIPGQKIHVDVILNAKHSEIIVNQQVELMVLHLTDFLCAVVDKMYENHHQNRPGPQGMFQ